MAINIFLLMPTARIQEKIMIDFPQIPEYTIQEKLGEGGMASVYLGTQKKLGRKVAIKILEESQLKNKTVEARFLREAGLAARLHHSNIISIFDTGMIGNSPFIVMEYLEETLKDRLIASQGFQIKPTDALEILKPIIKALDYAHSKGVIHRDIKTDNIMFRGDGTPVLVDFGIARAMEENNQLTQTGVSLGTPYYMSPEQCKAEPLDGRSDFYSLGVVLFELLTGSKPYQEETPVAVALKHIQEPIPRLPQDLTRFQILVDKMMAKKKEERIPNGKALLKLIDDVTEVPLPPPALLEKTSSAIPPLKKRRRSHFPTKKAVEIAVLAFLLASAAVIFMFFFNLGSKQPTGKKTGTASLNSPKIPGSKLSPSFSNDFLNQTPQYHADYRRALALFNSGKIDESSVLAIELKKTAVTPEITTLEEKISKHFLAIADTRYQTHLTDARDFLEKKDTPNTRKNIELAKQIKTTPELIELENQLAQLEKKSPITPKSKGSEFKETTQKQRDDQSYASAVSENTVSAYRKYIKDFTTGRHLAEAISKINKLEDAALLQKETAKKTIKQQTKLRSTYTTMDYQEVNSIIQKYNFFDSSFNKNGSFRSQYKKQFIGGAEVIIDETMGIMWYAGSSSKKMSYKKAEKWVGSLNQGKYGGYGNWRIPTVEEAATLLRKNKNEGELYMDGLFTGNTTSIWTGDTQRFQTYWIIRFDEGIIFPDSDQSGQYVIPVRPTQ